MKLCAGQCKYLIALYHLSRENSTVKSVDIAKKLSVTRPSVSRMLKCMARLEFINQDYSSSVILTDKGWDIAENLVNKLYDINMFFRDILKLDESSAYEQSIQFLAGFPEQTIERLSQVTSNTMKKRVQKNTEK